MDSVISETSKNQKSKCDQQRKEQETQTESDQFYEEDHEKNFSLIDSLKARIEELETESLVKNLDYKKLREDFNDFKNEIRLILESYNINSKVFVQNNNNCHMNNEIIHENIKEINENDILLEENIDLTVFNENDRLYHEMLTDMDSFSDDSFLDDDDLPRFSSFIDDCGFGFENKDKVEHDADGYDFEKNSVEKEVAGPSSSSNQQPISKLNKGKNKYDPLLDPLENITETSSLNPRASPFYPGEDEILYSNYEREANPFLGDSPLNIPFYTPENTHDKVEEIHTQVQRTLDLYKLLGQKINFNSFSYLLSIHGIDDLMNYEKSKEFNSLQNIHKKIIRKIITALLKDELNTANVFIRNTDEYRKRGLIPKLPKKFKSYDDYSKSTEFKCLTKKNKKIIKNLAEKEKNEVIIEV